ncbi:MAG: ATP-binding protein [Acidobacteria bacterium]|nr:ATP-binding protein [Acidobacteriota bacterium]
MKIAVIGTHGCGKTSLAFGLCTQLQQRGKAVELIVEMARRCPFPINEATSELGQMWILHAHILAEMEAAARSEVVICDRSVLDNYAYFCHKFGRRDHLDGMVRVWTDTYDLLVKVPIVEDWLIEDGVRSIDRGFQRSIDGLVEELLDALEIGQHRLLRTGSPAAVTDILTEVTSRLPKLNALGAAAR